MTNIQSQQQKENTERYHWLSFSVVDIAFRFPLVVCCRFRRYQWRNVVQVQMWESVPPPLGHDASFGILQVGHEAGEAVRLRVRGEVIASLLYSAMVADEGICNERPRVKLCC